MGNSSIATLVRGLIEDKINELGYELWDVEYVKEAASWYLRITIDSKNGISIDDCEKVHLATEPIVDKADPIDNQYYFEVTSPGIERVLRTREHFEKCVGQKAAIRLFKPLDGQKSIVGVILPPPEEKNTVEIKTDLKTYKLTISEVAKANIVFDFE